MRLLDASEARAAGAVRCIQAWADRINERLRAVVTGQRTVARLLLEHPDPRGAAQRKRRAATLLLEAEDLSGGES